MVSQLSTHAGRSRQAPDRRHSRKIRKNAHKKTHTYRLVRESGAATLQLALFRWKTAGKTCRSQLKLESDRSKVEQETNYHKTFSVTSALAQHPTKRAAASRRSGARQNVGDVTDRCFHYDVIGCETVTSEWRRGSLFRVRRDAHPINIGALRHDALHAIRLSSVHTGPDFLVVRFRTRRFHKSGDYFDEIYEIVCVRFVIQMKTNKIIGDGFRFEIHCDKSNGAHSRLAYRNGLKYGFSWPRIRPSWR